MTAPILQLYTESTDGSSIEAKESALVWHYRDADPDFGHWQAKELLDHLEGVLSNEPVEVVSGAAIVEVKPQVGLPRRARRRLAGWGGVGGGGCEDPWSNAMRLPAGEAGEGQ
jgi:trehalose 6-phosphate synthase/phosphatase